MKRMRSSRSLEGQLVVQETPKWRRDCLNGIRELYPIPTILVSGSAIDICAMIRTFACSSNLVRWTSMLFARLAASYISRLAALLVTDKSIRHL